MEGEKPVIGKGALPMLAVLAPDQLGGHPATAALVKATEVESLQQAQIKAVGVHD